MTKKEMLEILEEWDIDEEVDIDEMDFVRHFRELERERYERRKEWLDDYYQETAYGWRQQDIIDMYRRER